MATQDNNINDSLHHVTSYEYPRKPARIVSVKGTNTTNHKVIAPVRRISSFLVKKTFSQTEITMNLSRPAFPQTPSHTGDKEAALDLVSSEDIWGHYGADSTKTSVNSVKTAAEGKAEDFLGDEGEKADNAHQQPPDSKIRNAGERIFSKEVHSINISGLSKAHRVKPGRTVSDASKLSSVKYSILEENKSISNEAITPVKEEPKLHSEDSIPTAKEGSSSALKESKAPDPFECKYMQSEGKLREMISNLAVPANPLYNIYVSGNKSSALHKAYKHFVVSLFESMFLIKNTISKCDSGVRVPKAGLERPKGLKCNNFAI